jgi:hypothetical protein
MLFKAEYIERFSAGLADAMVLYSHNAATGVLVIWEVVRTDFYDQDVGSVVNAIQHNLHNEDLLNSIKFQQSGRIINLQKELEFEFLNSKFFEYYWSRLPVLLKCNRVIHKGKRLKPADKEIEIVSKACLKKWADTFSDMRNTCDFTGEFARFDRLTKWYIKSNRRDDEVYAIEWLFDSLEKLYPQITVDDNVGNITTHIIESCFPMFWDAFQAQYGKSLFCFANLGWFNGDLTTEELCEKYERESRGRDGKKRSA